MKAADERVLLVDRVGGLHQPSGLERDLHTELAARTAGGERLCWWAGSFWGWSPDIPMTSAVTSPKANGRSAPGKLPLTDEVRLFLLV